MIYNFIRQDNGSVRLFVNTSYEMTYIGAAVVDKIDSDTLDIIDSVGGRHRYELTEKHLDGSMTTNQFQVAGVSITGTVEEVCQQLDTVFPKATVAGGGDGSTITSLDDVPQGTTTKKLSLADYNTLQQIIQAFTTT